MSKSIKQIEQELLELKRQKTELEEKLMKAISSSLLKVAQNHPVQRIDKHCFVIRVSDLVGNPFTPTFYDWEQSVKIILKFLNTKPVEEWEQALIIKLGDFLKNQPVVFEFKRQVDGVLYKDKIPVSRSFIEQIIAELGKEHSEPEIRRCDHCGKPMKEGYYLGGEYACSDKCALALYHGDKTQMEEDLSHAGEIDGECYWTEWESIYLD